MKNSNRKTTKPSLKNATPLREDDIDELAEKWVEMMVDLLLSKDKKGLQKSTKFPKLNPA